MTAGLPGTGIGGLFYLMLVFWMPCRELYQLCRGRSSPQRWRAIGFYLALTAGIVILTYVEAWLISRAVTNVAVSLHLPVPGNGQGYRVLAGMSILMSLGSLAAVLLSVHVLRLVMWLNRRKPSLRPMVTGPMAGTAAAAQ
jgi:nicotinamide riboside transporter PnuC